MKKQILIISLFVLGSMNLFSQISKGDIELAQKYFGAEKAALVKEYMALTPQQDSLFWPVYNNYETERLELGKQRIALIDEYLKNVKDVTDEEATNLVNKVNTMDMSFKKLQKKYFSQLSKKIGAVKASQFYQLESYLNNVFNLMVQQNIPFVGDLEQKHDKMMKKK